MNIVLFEREEIDQWLPLADARAQHILGVLRRSIGEPFDAGIIDGPKGKGMLVQEHPQGLEIEFSWEDGEEEELPPIDLIIGLSRPQTNRKILQEATALGVRSMSFVSTERGEASYAKSRLWSTGEWRRHVIAGAAQAFTTRLPKVAFGQDLQESVARTRTDAVRIVLDNYESPRAFADYLKPPPQTGQPVNQAVYLAFGAERGWTSDERQLFRRSEFLFGHLGARPLRTETAIIAAVAITRSFMHLDA
jgi:16S rRNA (uracil1498-N3)-methyltransferase